MNVARLSPLNYLKNSLPAIFAVFFLFLASALIAFFFPERFSFFNSLLSELSSSLDGKGFFEILLFIFRNNFLSALFGLILGVLFGFVPLINSLVNGALVGYVLALTVKIDGLSVMWRLLPHGIFELPAVFISLGLGLRMAFVLLSKHPVELFKQRFFVSIKLFFMAVVPLLILAACIETALIVFLD